MESAQDFTLEKSQGRHSGHPSIWWPCSTLLPFIGNCSSLLLARITTKIKRTCHEQGFSVCSPQGQHSMTGEFLIVVRSVLIFTLFQLLMVLYGAYVLYTPNLAFQHPSSKLCHNFMVTLLKWHLSTEIDPIRIMLSAPSIKCGKV